MKITLKLFASLADYLPPGACHNQAQVEVPDGATPAVVLAQFKVPPQLAHLVMINGVYVSPEEREIRRLEPEQQFAVFPPVAGG